jgi:hypothetical protein
LKNADKHVQKIPGIEVFRQIRVSELSGEQLDSYASVFEEMENAFGIEGIAVEFEGTDSLEPLFHFHEMCRKCKSQPHLEKIEKLVAAIFATRMVDSSRHAREIRNAGFRRGELYWVREGRTANPAEHALGTMTKSRFVSVLEKSMGEEAAKKMPPAKVYEMLRHKGGWLDADVELLGMAMKNTAGAEKRFVAVDANNLLETRIPLFSLHPAHDSLLRFAGTWSELRKLLGSESFRLDLMAESLESLAGRSNAGNIKFAFADYRRLIESGGFEPERMARALDMIAGNTRGEYALFGLDEFKKLIESKVFDSEQMLNIAENIAMRTGGESLYWALAAFRELIESPAFEKERMLPMLEAASQSVFGDSAYRSFGTLKRLIGLEAQKNELISTITSVAQKTGHDVLEDTLASMFNALLGCRGEAAKAGRIMEIANSIEDGQRFATNFGIELQNRGMCKRLYAANGIRFSSRYSQELLYHQLEGRNGKPLMLVLFPVEDWNKSFWNVDGQGILTKLLGDFDVRMVEAERRIEARARLFRIAKKYGPISVAMVGGHGKGGSFSLGRDDRSGTIYSWDIADSQSALLAHFAKDATPAIIFLSCLLGAEYGFAHTLKDRLDKKTEKGVDMYTMAVAGYVRKMDYKGLQNGHYEFDMKFGGPETKPFGRGRRYHVHQREESAQISG